MVCKRLDAIPAGVLTNNPYLSGAVGRDINSPVWTRDTAVYAELDSWTDPGERLVVHSIADQVRGRPLLDVGVGAGRSAWLVGLLSEDYVAVDYTPEMVELAHRNLPNKRIQLADARSLVDFQDNHFALVFFSHAGLDSLDHEGRNQALREFFRVLQPGGFLVYSTLNRNGTFYKCGPGPVGKGGHRPGPYQTARFVARLAQRPIEHLHGFANVRRLRPRFEDHGSWAIDTMPTHEWDLVVHYVTSIEARREVVDNGFEFIRAVARQGEMIDIDHAETSTPWFHVVARKPMSGVPTRPLE